MTNRRLLIAAFAVALMVTAVFGGRLILSTVYWSRHRDQPIEPWMTVGMVARSYGVPRGLLGDALLVSGGRDRRPLSEIAREKNWTEAELTARLEAAIAAARAKSPPRSQPTAQPGAGP